MIWSIAVRRLQQRASEHIGKAHHYIDEAIYTGDELHSLTQGNAASRDTHRGVFFPKHTWSHSISPRCPILNRLPEVARGRLVTCKHDPLGETS